MLSHSFALPAPEILPPLDHAEVNETGEFDIAASGVLHDLGNLIQVATSALNVLARAPEMPAIHRDPIMHRARTSLDHAGMIVRQNIGQVHERADTPVRCEVAACLADVVALAVTDDKVRLVHDIAMAADLPDVACDPIGLRRAMLNLLFNARDAMGGAGTVRIAARATACLVELSVSDSGTGMTPAVLARVFDPFFTTKRDGLGGIGLPTVERFVRNAGGNVSIESEPGIGTTVTLRLPALPQEIQT